MTTADDGHENGIIPAGPSRLELRSDSLVSRGLAYLASLSEEAKTTSLASLGDIFEAVKTGDLQRVRAIAAADPAQANARDDYYESRTPLHYAAASGHIAVIKILIAFGAKVDAGTGKEVEDEDEEGRKFRYRDPGQTPLTLACWERQSEAVRTLIDNGADVNTGDHYGYTPLHAVAVSGDVRAAELLLCLLYTSDAADE